MFEANKNFDSDFGVNQNQNNLFATDKIIDFNGFDKFAKLVEFDEKIFDNK